MEFNTYDYVEPEFKEVIVTSEYAAQHFHRMGWMWGRLEVMREQQTWGALREQRVEKELREKIAQEIEGWTMTWQQFPDGIPLHAKCPNCNAEPYTPVCDSSRDYFAQSIYQHIAKIVRGNND